MIYGHLHVQHEYYNEFINMDIKKEIKLFFLVQQVKSSQRKWRANSLHHGIRVPNSKNIKQRVMGLQLVVPQE